MPDLKAEAEKREADEGEITEDVVGVVAAKLEKDFAPVAVGEQEQVNEVEESAAVAGE